MKRLIIIVSFAVIIGGCNLRNERKIEAHKRYRSAQSRIICGVGAEQLKVGELDQAQDSAVKAIDRDPECVVARVLLAKVLLEKGRYAEAGQELDRAEKLRPEAPEIHYLRGVAWEKRGQHAEALKCYQKARALDSSNASYVTASAEVLVAMGDARQALTLLETGLERTDDAPSVLALAAQVAMRADEPDKAAVLFRRCLDLHPESVQMQEGLAKARFFARQYAQALEALAELSARPEYQGKKAWVYVMIGDSHMALGRPGPAGTAYEIAAGLTPDAAPVWVRLAKAALALGEAPAAGAAARRALALEASSLEATIVLGYAMLRQGHVHEATELLAGAAEKHPDDATLQCTLGRCYAAVGQTSRAVACYQQALKSDPAHPLASSLLAAAKEPN